MSSAFDHFNEDWTEMLIKAVKKRPALYDRTLKKTASRNLTACLWTEICQSLVPSWNNLSAAEKSLKGKEIQGKWRNLRTSFKRELNVQKNPKSGQLNHKRRKYIYFQDLLFLLPAMEDRETEGSPMRDEDDDDTYVDDDNDSSCMEEDKKDRNYESSFIQHINKMHTLDDKEEEKSYDPLDQPTRKVPAFEEETVVNITKDKNEVKRSEIQIPEINEIDEDRLFLLSLMPSFRKMSADQKLDAKVEFLLTIKRIMQAQPNM